jgi:putative acetyltransferase
MQHRRKGVAAGLIRHGLTLAKEGGWKGVFVLGNPLYYKRFGFEPSLAAGFTSPYAGPNLMALALQSDELPMRQGRLEYAGAFAAFE